MISPCLISPAGIDFFTAQIMMSPMPAILRLNLPLLLLPPSTLMHIACLAPVLSAMSTYVCCWIMVAALHLRFAICDLRFDSQSQIANLKSQIFLPLFRRLSRHDFLGRDLHRLLGGALADPKKPVVLRTRQRPALGDLDLVALMRFVLLIMSMKHGPPLQILHVVRMAHLILHDDLDGLVALVRCDDDFN